MNSLKNPGYILYRCHRCYRFWAASPNPAATVINSFCPTCIPKITTVLGDIPLACREITEESRREHLATVRAMRAKGIQKLKADVYRLQERYPTRPTVHEARQFLRCDQHHVIEVMWFAYPAKEFAWPKS